MKVPTVTEIRAARERLNDFIVETPVWPWRRGTNIDIATFAAHVEAAEG